MPSVNFYLNRPFAKGPGKFQRTKVLNPSETMVFIYVTYPGRKIIKCSTGEKALAKNWDFNEKCFRSSSAGSLTHNSRLAYFKSEVLQAISRATMQNPEITLPQIKEAKHTIFWQIDINSNVRSGKVIPYNPETGKRGDKTDWIHPMISRKTGKPYILKQCYFGEQQLASNPGKVVAVVESEKTAIIASIPLPEYLWIATGGVTGCRWMDKGVSSVLLGRQIILSPDLNMFDRWSGYAIELQRELGLRINVSDIVEKVCSAKEKQDKAGYDVADFLLKSK